VEENLNKKKNVDLQNPDTIFVQKFFDRWWNLKLKLDRKNTIEEETKQSKLEGVKFVTFHPSFFFF